jgi:transcription initiation factor TFIID subunit 2
MDLGTIAKKIDQKKYKTMGQLAADIELIFAKCARTPLGGEQAS